jgi:HK97 family phage portal protein
VKSGSQPALLTDPGVYEIDLYTWKHQALVSCLLRGNAYGYITNTDSRGVPSKVMWLRPDQVFIEESDPLIPPRFYWQGRQIDRDRLIHIPGYVVPGRVEGLSPIGLFRQQIETGMEAQSFGSKFFRRGTTPPGMLKNTQKTMTPEFAAETKSRFLAAVSSSEPFVAGADWSYDAITIPQGDAQFLSGIKATANQIAAAYRVAPQDVGGADDGTSLTYKNLEQDQIRFSIRTLRPWAERFEAVFNRYFPAQFVKFNLDAGIRADMITRYQAHQIAIQSEFETRDEARQAEGNTPLTDEQKQDFDSIRKQGTPPATATPSIGKAE